MSELSEIVKERRPPGSLASGLLISRLFFRVTLGRKRIIWIGLLMLVPLGIAAYLRFVAGEAGQALFDKLTASVFLTILAMGLPLYLGVSALRDEIDDKTIVYLFARPLHRAVIVGGKILSVALVVSLALVVDLALIYVLAQSADGATAIGSGILHFVRAAGILALGVVVYTSLFALVGVLLRRPMILAILISAGWEFNVSRLPGAFPRLTLMYYLKSLLGLAPEGGGGLMSVFLPPIETAPITTALAVLAAATVIFFGLALFVGSKKEYRV